MSGRGGVEREREREREREKGETVNAVIMTNSLDEYEDVSNMLKKVSYCPRAPFPRLCYNCATNESATFRLSNNLVAKIIRRIHQSGTFISPSAANPVTKFNSIQRGDQKMMDKPGDNLHIDAAIKCYRRITSAWRIYPERKEKRKEKKHVRVETVIICSQVHYHGN